MLTNGSACDLLAVDFDEDGDVDVILGRDKYQPTYSRYFERISDGQIVERNENQNPLEFFEEDIKVIADLDGDGQLEIITSWYSDFGNTLLTQRTYFRVFRRALDGSFVEAVDKPFLNMQYFSHVNDYRFDVFVADWNSDGLPDVLTVSVSPIHFCSWPTIILIGSLPSTASRSRPCAQLSNQHLRGHSRRRPLASRCRRLEP